jgi:hypothetical protein
MPTSTVDGGGCRVSVLGHRPTTAGDEAPSLVTDRRRSKMRKQEFVIGRRRSVMRKQEFVIGRRRSVMRNRISSSVDGGR